MNAQAHYLLIIGREHEKNRVLPDHKEFEAQDLTDAITQTYKQARETLSSIVLARNGEDKRTLLTMLAIDGRLVPSETIIEQTNALIQQTDYRWRPERGPKVEEYWGAKGVMYRMNRTEQLMYLVHEAGR